MDSLVRDANIICDFLVAKEAEMNTVQAALVEKVRVATECKGNHTVLVDTASTDTQVAEVIKFIFDKMSGKGFGFLEQLGTQALQMVFTDENYGLVIKIGSRGNEKTVEFLLRDNTRSVEHPLSECGGGVQVLVSFVFRVYFILKTNLRRVIVMDETMSQLSPQYTDNLLQFMSLLVERFQFRILWISHSPMLEGKVSKFYEISKGKLYIR